MNIIRIWTTQIKPNICYDRFVTFSCSVCCLRASRWFLRKAKMINIGRDDEKIILQQNGVEMRDVPKKIRYWSRFSETILKPKRTNMMTIWLIGCNPGDISWTWKQGSCPRAAKSQSRKPLTQRTSLQVRDGPAGLLRMESDTYQVFVVKKETFLLTWHSNKEVVQIIWWEKFNLFKYRYFRCPRKEGNYFMAWYVVFGRDEKKIIKIIIGVNSAFYRRETKLPR